MTDWGRGSYELTAAELLPVASVVADAVEPVAGEPALDLACGTGNAALELARRGASVTGLDGAARLLGVAAERAADEGLDAEWVEGDLVELPFPDDSFEAITSVFGLIFAGSPEDAAAEVGRVLAPQGRLAFTTWADGGLFSRLSALARAAAAEALDTEPGDADPPFAWGEEEVLRELFSEHGIVVQVERRELAIASASARELNDRWFEQHPMWLALSDLIGEERYAALREESLPLIEAANEADDGHRFTSTYLLAAGSPV